MLSTLVPMYAFPVFRSVVDPDSDFVGSETFSRIRIRNEFEENYSEKLIKLDNKKCTIKKPKFLFVKKYLFL
jgi:hypothetical protein